MSGSFTPVLPSEGEYDVEPGEEPVPWFKIIRTLAIVGAVVAAIVFVIIPGYSAGEDDAARERIDECSPVPEATRDAIAARVTGDVMLTAWALRESVDTPGRFFVSAEVREEGLVEGANGELATWLTADPEGLAADFTVMGPIAREHSEWPDHPESIEVTDEGAIGSRFCSGKLRADKWIDEYPEFR